jgi:hypothetical protein
MIACLAEDADGVSTKAARSMAKLVAAPHFGEASREQDHMPGRKIDFFGTFLENMKSPARAMPRALETDPLDEVLKALKDGEHSAKDLIPLVGNSASEFLTVSNQLVELGWVRRLDGDVLQLTDKGREIAELLR